MKRAVILDSETTGLDASRHQILEIALKVVETGTGEWLGAFQSVVSLSKKEWGDADPKALRVNGFTWRDVQARGRSRDDIAVDVCALFSRHNLTFSNAFFLCQNPSFDRAFFSQICSPSVQKSCAFPFYWMDFASMHWALTAKEMTVGRRKLTTIPCSKDGIARFRGLPEETKPHTAMNGVDHLLLLFSKIVGFPHPKTSCSREIEQGEKGAETYRRSGRKRTPTPFYSP